MLTLNQDPGSGIIFSPLYEIRKLVKQKLNVCFKQFVKDYWKLSDIL